MLVATLFATPAMAQWLPSSSSDPPESASDARPAHAESTDHARFVGTFSGHITVPPFSTLEVGTCRLPGATHTGDTVVTIAPERAFEITSDDAEGCGLGSFAEWTAGATAATVELRVRCYSGSGCSGTLAWRISRPIGEHARTLDSAHPLSLLVTLAHGRTLRVESGAQRGAIEYMLVNQDGQVAERRTLARGGSVEFSTPFEARRQCSLVGRCVDGPCSASVRVAVRPEPRHDVVRWEISASARGAIGGSNGSTAFGGGGDGRVHGRFGPVALRVETPTIGAAWSPQGGVFAAGVRGLVGYATGGIEVGGGFGAITLNRRLGGVAERVGPEALAWVRLGNPGVSMDLVFGATRGAGGQPWVSVAQAALWGRVARSIDLGLQGAYSIHGELRADGALRYWVHGRGVEPGAWAIAATLGYAEYFYQPQCPLGACSDALSYRTATLGLGVTWRP
jgi:hypothetical protein